MPPPTLSVVERFSFNTRFTLVCAAALLFLVLSFLKAVKVRLQTETAVSFKEQIGAFSAAKQLVKEGGLWTRGLYKGLTSTLGRYVCARQSLKITQLGSLVKPKV